MSRVLQSAFWALACASLVSSCTCGTRSGVDGGDSTDATSGTVCGNGIIEPGEECEGTDLNGLSCVNASSATYSALQDGTLGCYPAGTIADDGTNVSCTFDFTQCIGPDIRAYGDGVINGSFVEENASVSMCEVSEGCAGATSGRRLLKFNLVSWNGGNAGIDFGSPAAINPPYTGLWEAVCGGGLEWIDYARYWLEDGAGNVAAEGRKGSFCFIDSFGQTPDPRYSGPACAASHGCGTMGMEPGCHDVYGIGLSCQYIDVTDIAPGNYTLCVEIDHNNEVAELDDHNNTECMPYVLN